jgi:hypothetical protein
MSEYFVKCAVIIGEGFLTFSYGWSGIVEADNGQDAMRKARETFNDEMVRENIIKQSDEVYIEIEDVKKL